MLGSLGVPGLATLDCLHGECCRAFRATATEAWPAAVPFTSVHGLRDTLVAPRMCEEPAARNVAVDTGHIGLLHAPDALVTVADALAAHAARPLAAS